MTLGDGDLREFDAHFPRGTYEGTWTFGLTTHEISSLPGVLERDGRISFPEEHDNEPPRGEAEIEFERADGTTFTRSFPVQVVPWSGSFKIELHAFPNELIPMAADDSVELVRSWDWMDATLDGDRLRGTMDYAFQATVGDDEEPVEIDVKLAFVGETSAGEV